METLLKKSQTNPVIDKIVLFFLLKGKLHHKNDDISWQPIKAALNQDRPWLNLNFKCQLYPAFNPPFEAGSRFCEKHLLSILTSTSWQEVNSTHKSKQSAAQDIIISKSSLLSFQVIKAVTPDYLAALNYKG